ncbi:SLATT domain-containing protein [Caballeronia sp. GACF4]|uniref:SLATT domain-containing protein n=1 Tax=Caballeronia sp. GACF4 TaxID=2921763 RepID=UPI002028AF00|nr:SLATT domain-containing protein [Caballeronia sp. GACF4]
MTPENKTKEAIRAELQRIEEDCTHSGKKQYNAGERWGTYNFWLGVPSTILGVVAGATFMKSHGDIAGGLAMLAALLTALMTFLKPSERAAAHKAAGDQYLALRNDARVFRQIRLDYACDDQAAIASMDEFTKRRNELNQASPLCARRDFDRARAGIEDGEATHNVDAEAK